jgi:peroxin-19
VHIDCANKEMDSREDAQAKIDAELDAALDALDDSSSDEENAETTSRKLSLSKVRDTDAQGITISSEPSLPSPPRPVMGPPRPPAASGNATVTPEKFLTDFMQQIMVREDGGEGDDDPFLGKLMQEMQTELRSELAQLGQEETLATPLTARASASASSPKKKPNKTSRAKARKGCKGSASSSQEEDIGRAFSNLMEDMAKIASLNEDEIETRTDGDLNNDEAENVFKSLMEGLSGTDGDMNADAVIDGMMEQLMSKDLMYEPMKQVADKFPLWLEGQRGILSGKDFEEYVQILPLKT